MYALGIDLGTTFTAAATWRNGHAETASLGSRGAAIPSVVLLREDETFMTGEGANRRGLSEPQRVAREFKRRIGDTTPILLGGVPYSAEALMARLLRSVVDEVVKREGGAPAAICVSHPANWGPYKTDLLLQAVRLANLDEPVTFTSEPEAAAVFYAQQQRIEPGAIIAVYDLGGGTFDAAVLRKTVVGFEILGRPEGIERLGGIDFDAAVFNHVARALGGKLNELDEDDPQVIAAVARLRDECILAKEALSADTDVSIPILLPNLSTEVRLTRSELEAMVRPALSDSIEALKRALRSAKVAPEQLHSVLLVGGSSRMPVVAQLVSAELGRPVAVDAHPKHAVSLGAAWLASGALSNQTAPRAVSGRAVAGGLPPVPAVPVTPVVPVTPARPATPARPGPPAGIAPVGPAPAGPAHFGSTPPPVSGSARPVPPGMGGPGGQVPGGQPGGHGPGVASPRAGGFGAAPIGMGAAGSAAVGGPAIARSDSDATQFVGGGSSYPPPTPAMPSTPGGAKQHLPLIAAGAALLLVLVVGGAAIALTGGEKPVESSPKPGSSTSVEPTKTAPKTPTEPAVPADEQCTEAIKSQPRWVCLTKATMTGDELTIEYEFGDNGQPFSISGGYHLHIYGANEDGSAPAASVMGAQAADRGSWYVEDQQPSVHSAGTDQYQTVGDNPKVCARIANGSHRLVTDGTDSYATGNCVPVDRG